MASASVGKRPPTPFFMFRAKVYQQVKSENPDSRQPEIAKIIGKMWKQLDQDTKKGYNDEYVKEQKMFKKGALDSETSDKQEDDESEQEEQISKKKKKGKSTVVSPPRKAQVMKAKAASKKLKGKPQTGSGRKQTARKSS